MFNDGEDSFPRLNDIFVESRFSWAPPRLSFERPRTD